MIAPIKNRAADHRGAMLITVLVLLLILTLLAAVLLEMSVVEQRLGAYDTEQQQLRYSADSGMELACALLAGGLAVGEEAVELRLAPDDATEVYLRLESSGAEAGDAAEQVACTSVATRRGVSGRDVSGAIYCRLQRSDDGEVAVEYYHYRLAPGS